MELPLNNRKVLELKGSDSRKFLQNLVSNDVNSLNDKLVYSALLTPQGKYIADFFIVPLKDAIGIDVHVELAQTLLEKLKIYKLRSDVEIKEADAVVKGQTASSSFKNASTTNNLKLLVPQHIKEGDKILINAENLQYLEKSKD